jgi:hypothetical protein
LLIAGLRAGVSLMVGAFRRRAVVCSAEFQP